jgi:steroid 5-alpha reductase family enzyme
MTVIVAGLLLLMMYLCSMVAIAQYKSDTSIANFTWGGGVMLVSVYTFFTLSLFLPRQIIVTAMITMWASRLIIHVYRRYTGNDPRFIAWKWQGFKALVINSMWIFGQIIMIAIMAYPIILVNMSGVAGLTLLDAIGMCVWIFGFVCEMASDQQLFTFMSNSKNKGKVMRYGLWHYSRHPNYFGEILMWWGIYMIALSVPYGWSGIIAPVTISVFLIFITGIPWIEKTMEGTAEYQEYKEKTSMLIPWFAQK